MDTPRRFACILMHPGLFPGLLLDFANPPRTKVTAEIDSEKLSFLPQNKTVSLASIGSVAIQHLSARSQLLEILRKTMIRILMLTAFLSICQVASSLGQSLGPIFSILIALAVATILSGPLFFLRNGGLEIKDAVVRFQFIPLGHAKPFYLEVEPAQEDDVSRTLGHAGLELENEGDEEVWECEDCGAVVSAEATACPTCGSKLDD